MTIHFPGSQMAAEDFRACQVLLETLVETDSPFARLLRQKLSSARAVPDDGIDPLVVTFNSRVEFQVNDEAPETRILVRREFCNGLVGLTLPVTTPRGIALLGLRQGQSCAFEEGGRMRAIAVRRVAYQPQAARSGCSPQASPRQSRQAEIIDFAQARVTRSACAWSIRSSSGGRI